MRREARVKSVNRKLEIREFQPVDNVQYASWFSDPVIDRFLGPEWSNEELDEILNDKTGAVLSAFHSDELVGVVSLTFPNIEHASFGITGIAVKPNSQRQGFGKEIILTTQSYYNVEPGQQWIAFVKVSNIPAQYFMEKQGWRKNIYSEVRETKKCYSR